MRGHDQTGRAVVGDDPDPTDLTKFANSISDEWRYRPTRLEFAITLNAAVFSARFHGWAPHWPIGCLHWESQTSSRAANAPVAIMLNRPKLCRWVSSILSHYKSGIPMRIQI